MDGFPRGMFALCTKGSGNETRSVDDSCDTPLWISSWRATCGASWTTGGVFGRRGSNGWSTSVTSAAQWLFLTLPQLSPHDLCCVYLVVRKHKPMDDFATGTARAVLGLRRNTDMAPWRNSSRYAEVRWASSLSDSWMAWLTE